MPSTENYEKLLRKKPLESVEMKIKKSGFMKLGLLVAGKNVNRQTDTHDSCFISIDNKLPFLIKYNITVYI